MKSLYGDSENYSYNEEGQLYWNTPLVCPLISLDSESYTPAHKGFRNLIGIMPTWYVKRKMRSLANTRKKLVRNRRQGCTRQASSSPTCIL